MAIPLFSQLDPSMANPLAAFGSVGGNTDIAGPLDASTLSFIIGALAGAGLPIISRALRPGRTAGERQAQMGAGPLNPQAILQAIAPQARPGPDQPTSALSLLPMLAAQRGLSPQILPQVPKFLI